MQQFQVDTIGRFQVKGDSFSIALEPRYIPALKELDGFTHIQLLWWCSELDSKEARSVLTAPQPYKKAPKEMGIFATRSPVRPNPIALSTAEVISIDHNQGEIQITYTDAFDDTPLLDIKPYTPSIDRIENPGVPNWCSHWPQSFEASGTFDWEAEFNF